MSKHKSKDKKHKHRKKHSKHKKSKKKSKHHDTERLNKSQSIVNNKRERTQSESSNSSCSSSGSKKDGKLSKKRIKVDDADDMSVPIDLMASSKTMRPQTQDEWKEKQSIIKHVLDPETGRYRLIKGDGEVLEEIVSKSQHKEINKKATAFDGEYFESKTVKK